MPKNILRLCYLALKCLTFYPLSGTIWSHTLIASILMKVESVNNQTALFLIMQFAPARPSFVRKIKSAWILMKTCTTIIKQCCDNIKQRYQKIKFLNFVCVSVIWLFFVPSSLKLYHIEFLGPNWSQQVVESQHF